jgi:hypothetical protein
VKSKQEACVSAYMHVCPVCLDMFLRNASMCQRMCLLSATIAYSASFSGCLRGGVYMFIRSG